MSFEEFLELVAAWVVEKEKEISFMWPQKGGWEKWAQSEIFSYINSKRPSADIMREQPVYGSAKKSADFLLNNGNHVNEKVIVELKAQSFENYKNFVPELKKDTAKLIKELHPSYNGSALVVLGFYFTNVTQFPDYFSYRAIGKGEIGICWAIDQNS